jgi:AmiR/NasT family two-component response regulator
VDAARTGQAFVVEDMGSAGRWPGFARAAVHEGVQSLASVSAVGLAQVRAEAENLRAALTSRANLDRAVGIIMSQQQLNQDEGFAALSGMSQRSDRKLRDIARALVDSFGNPHTEPGK